MEEIVLKMQVPEDLSSELKEVSKARWSLVINRLLKEKLSRLIRLEKIIRKSELSKTKAFEIADKISESLAKRYEAMYKRMYG